MFWPTETFGTTVCRFAPLKGSYLIKFKIETFQKYPLFADLKDKIRYCNEQIRSGNEIVFLILSRH